MATKEEINSEELKQRENSKPPKKRGWPFCVVFFVSAWMFFLGVVVGRGTFPVNFDINELEKKIVALKKAALESEELRIQKTSPVSPDVKSELEFYEALKMPEQNDLMYLAEPKPSSAVKPDTPSKTDNTVKPAPPVKYKIVTKSEKIPELKKNAIEATSPFSEPSNTVEKSDKHYSIQVASLKDSIEADRLVEIFRRRGYPAYRASAEVRNTGTWHRVRIGPFTKQSEALKTLGPVSQESKGALIIEHSP
jgi:cell division septation protein DedD